MSAGEVAGRLRDATVKQAWRLSWLRPHPGKVVASWRPAFALPPLNALNVPVSDEARDRVVAEAERILSGTVHILSYETTALGETPDWFLDIQTGLRAPRDIYCFDVAYRDLAVAGEVKYVWEPSRHHHLTVLAAAYYLTGRSDFAERAARHLDSWWRENPFLCGIHWTSGIEIGIRLMSWVWVRRLLDSWPGVTVLFDTNPRFHAQLFAHQAYLSALPSRGTSANNHAIAEAAGLFAAASAFPLFSQSAKWRRQAARLLEHHFDAQTFADGLNRELATAYHGLTLELVLLAAAEDDPDKRLLPAALWDRLARMMDALASMVDVAGQPPAQGDDDGGYGLLVEGPDFDRWQSLLATGAALFGRPGWWPELVGGDLRTGLLAQCAHPQSTGAIMPVQPIRHFVEGGMVLLRDVRPRPDEVWVRCDHGPLGFLKTAAHGHADALSIEVRHGGIPVLVDPGTYRYHGHEAWRRYFRSTLGHNTLEVDGIDQCRAGGTFFWLDHPVSRLIEVDGLDDGRVASWSACHDGYSPALHHRRVALDRHSRCLDIDDWLEGAGAHAVRLAFHLGPRVTCHLEGSTASLSWAGGTATMTLPTSLDWLAHYGQPDPLMGWTSSGFGHVEPSVTLIGSGTLGSGERLQTHIIFKTSGAA